LENKSDSSRQPSNSTTHLVASFGRLEISLEPIS
jgi:hypothetical protein